MKKLLLGVAPTRRFCFSAEDAHKYKLLVEQKLRDWNIEFINIDSVNPEGLLVTMDDAHKAAELFIAKHVDAVFTPHVNFGTEEVVATMCKKVGKPVLLWGPRDEAPEAGGVHLRDTQCGLFATSNVLQKFNVKFTYILNSRVDDEVFKRGLFNFIAAARVVKGFMGAKIGQISTRPPNFYTVMINEQDLLTKFGIEMVPITLMKVKHEVERLVREDARVKDEVEAICGKIALKSVVDAEALGKIAALKLFMLDWAREKDLAGIAIRCHEDLPEDMKFYSCFSNAEVTEAGVPVACETDIHGAISSILIQNASNAVSTTFLADMTNRHPDNDNAELLWHCGNFPFSLCKNCSEAFIGGHCNIVPGLPGTGNFEIQADDITVCRFDGMSGNYKLFIGEGKAVRGPFNAGTYVWMEVKDWPLWEEKLIYGPYIHHVAGIPDKCAAALFEACRYIDGLEPDPATPTEQEIKAWLRGK